jgi:nucleotide-binding universal stress UspA family protein/nitrite reductase/ring-hydroxylating ferredoxin subunit
MGYRTIVAATDGSPTARVAVGAAALLATRFRAELVLATAFEPPAVSAQQARDLVDGIAAELAGYRVAVRTATQLGPPAEAVVGMARRVSADLVVVGNVGIGKARRLGLGGVADQIAHRAPCDVLIVDTSHEHDRKAGYRRILVGTDGSPTATEAARKAFELAVMLRSSVTLVHVGDPLLGAIALEQTEANKLGNTVVDRALRQGTPADEMLRLLGEDPHDLVLVGNRGMSGPRRLLGGVPNELAHHAPCDVLIARTVGRTVDDLAPGHGGVVELDGSKVAAYRDDGGEVHVVSPRCTHMGCTVDWNDAEKTWDCPCHGSRYAWSGEVIEGPATKGLDPA